MFALNCRCDGLPSVNVSSQQDDLCEKSAVVKVAGHNNLASAIPDRHGFATLVDGVPSLGHHPLRENSYWTLRAVQYVVDGYHATIGRCSLEGSLEV